MPKKKQQKNTPFYSDVKSNIDLEPSLVVDA